MQKKDIRIYRLIPENTLKPYASLLAGLLFDLKTLKSDTAIFSVEDDNSLLYRRPKSFEKPLRTPQEQTAVIKMVSDYLHTRHQHIQELVDKKRIPDGMRGLLMPHLMKMLACVPCYYREDESESKAVKYWVLRYEMELPYSSQNSAKWQGQRIAFYCSGSIIGMDYESRIIADMATSKMITPAPLQNPTPEEEESDAEDLPLLYLTQGDLALPFWMAKNGILIPACKEGSYGNLDYDNVNVPTGINLYLSLYKILGKI